MRYVFNIYIYHILTSVNNFILIYWLKNFQQKNHNFIKHIFKLQMYLIFQLNFLLLMALFLLIFNDLKIKIRYLNFRME